MHPRRKMARRASGLGLLALLVVLVLEACGGVGKVAKPRPLPENREALAPGEYRSEEFEPSFSFGVGKGWEHVPVEASDWLNIQRTDETGGLGFVVAHDVYEPTKTSTPNVVEAPNDFVGWLRRHPYLRTTDPERVSVGGAEGVRFDVSAVEDLPDAYQGRCGSGCVDIGRLSTGSQTSVGEGEKVRLTLLEDVEGETVQIAIYGPADYFEEFAPEAQKVVDSVKWGGS